MKNWDKCGQLVGPIGIYQGGDGKVYVRIEAWEDLEEMLRKAFGADIEVIFQAPRNRTRSRNRESLDARIALVEEELRTVKQHILEEK